MDSLYDPCQFMQNIIWRSSAAPFAFNDSICCSENKSCLWLYSTNGMGRPGRDEEKQTFHETHRHEHGILLTCELQFDRKTSLNRNSGSFDTIKKFLTRSPWRSQILCTVYKR